METPEPQTFMQRVLRPHVLVLIYAGLAPLLFLIVGQNDSAQSFAFLALLSVLFLNAEKLLSYQPQLTQLHGSFALFFGLFVALFGDCFFHTNGVGGDWLLLTFAGGAMALTLYIFSRFLPSIFSLMRPASYIQKWYEVDGTVHSIRLWVLLIFLGGYGLSLVAVPSHWSLFAMVMGVCALPRGLPLKPAYRTPQIERAIPVIGALLLILSAIILVSV